VSAANVVQFPAVQAQADWLDDLESHVTVQQLARLRPELGEMILEDDLRGVLFDIDAMPGTTYSAEELMQRAPSWAKALIVAELVENRSDSQSDYFAHTTRRAVAIGWRKSSREDFRALRRAAGSFEPTAHMGPGLDEWTARVYLVDDVPREGYWKGSYSHWHQEIDDSGRQTFGTEAEARAFVDAAGAPHPIMFGEQMVRFEWKITKESFEHRENYSMGGGNYLKAGGRHNSGWRVESWPLPVRDEHIEIGGEIAAAWWRA
jgi:hypothetical protein